MESDIGEVCNTYNKAIEFALELNTYHVKLFLELWHNGDYEEIEQLFPEFDTTCAEVVFTWGMVNVTNRAD